MDLQNVLLSDINKIILLITEPHLKKIFKLMKIKPIKFFNRIDLSFKFDTLTNDKQKCQFLEHFKEILRQETTFKEHEAKAQAQKKKEDKEEFINNLKNQIEEMSANNEIIISYGTNKKMKTETNFKNYISDILEEAKPPTTAEAIAQAIAQPIAQPIAPPTPIQPIPTKEQILNLDIIKYYNEMREKLNDETDQPEENENKYYFKNTYTDEPLTNEELKDLKRYRLIYKIYDEINKYISMINAKYRNNEIEHTNHDLNNSFNNLLNLSYTEIFNEMKELKNKLKGINKFKTDTHQQAQQRAERNYFNISINKPLEPPEREPPEPEPQDNQPEPQDNQPPEEEEPQAQEEEEPEDNETTTEEPQEREERNATQLEREREIINLEFDFMSFQDEAKAANKPPEEPPIFPDIQQELTREQKENLIKYKQLKALYNKIDEYIFKLHKEKDELIRDNIDNEDLNEIIKKIHRLKNKIYNQFEELTQNLKITRLITKINNFNKYPLLSYENYIYMLIRTTDKFYILQPLKYKQINSLYKHFLIPYEITPNNKNNIRLAKTNGKLQDVYIYEELKRMT
jgi:hypothetical protein